MSTELVLLHHNQPMTTSLAIASGVDLQHKNVLELIYKHVDSLAEFGKVEFEIQPAGEDSRFEIGNSAFQMAADDVGVEIETRNSRSIRGRPTEVAFLNEQQSTLLIAFMRNSPIVIKFKVALVKAFYELRDRITQQGYGSVRNHRGRDLLSRSGVPDRLTNSLINRRASELAQQLTPGIKRFLREKIDYEQRQALSNGKTGVDSGHFIADVLFDCFHEEVIRDLYDNI